MRQYDSGNLIIHPGNSPDPDVVVEVTPALAGWNTIHFQSRRLAEGTQWSFQTRAHELVMIPLSGSLDVVSDRGSWTEVGARSTVFAGLPHALYLPRQTSFTVTARTGSEFAIAWTEVEEDYPARMVAPQEVEVEIRGGDHATRQINRMLPPGFPCSRLVVVEVYTPGGNWSSYPPHKHDLVKLDEQGQPAEADLDEIYYYKIDRQEGYALQQVYTGPESPLQRAGLPLDAALVARTNDVVLVPEGYHPVSCPPGYTAYYLNVLAGSHQSLAAKDDPDFAWVKDTYQARDPRLPIYPVNPGQLRFTSQIAEEK
jgi:5-deoxy-glucuronate isomerase